MTDIPEDDFERARSDASGSARRFAAAVSGAIEGFLEGLDDPDLAQGARESMQAAGDVVRETGSEVRTQGDSPEMRALGRDVAGATGRVRDTVADATDAARSKAEGAKDAFEASVESAKESYHDAKEGVRVRLDAVKESGRRAARAPRKIGHELGQAFAAWKNALVTTIAMMVGLFVMGIVTLVVLTIAMVAGLNQMLGDPKGTWLTFAIYVVVMLIMWAVMRSRHASARAETRRRVENAKQEVRHVGTPVRRAFGGRGGTGL